jgi:Tol biopolymer transport system component
MSAARPGGIAVILTMLVSAACQPAAPAPSATASVVPPSASATAGSPAPPSSSASQATASGPGEPWIVYQGAPQGLSLARPDGTGNHVILGPPGEQLHPDWSPDGSQIAYVQATEDASHIWITDPQGADPKPLLSESPAALSGLFWDNPAWSPDGSRIASIAYEGDPQRSLPARSVLAIVAVDSGDIEIAGELASADMSLYSFPRWSPDGNALVVVEDRFSGQDYVGGRIAVVRRTDAGWSKPDPITDVVAAPRGDWHPTDDLIVFCTNDVGGVQVTDDASELFTVRADGTGLQQITGFGPGGERASQPTWTSDGRIIFTHITGTGDEQLTVAFIGADGSDLEIAVGANLVGIGNRPHPRLRPIR